MGVLSQAALHALTDRAAAVIRTQLSGGRDAELVGWTNTSFWDQAVALGDPDVVNALVAPALALDRRSLPENYPAALGNLLADGPLKSFAAALVAQPAAASLTFAAYLASVSASLHPLAAELLRTVAQEAGVPAANVFPPLYQSRAPARVFAGADGSLADFTAAAGSAATGDLALFAANGNALYLGARHKFTQAIPGLSTLASATIAPLIQYWNGAAWTAAPGLVDNSAGFTKNDTIKWTLPGDWEPSYQDAAGNVLPDKARLYYIRIARTAGTLVTPPVGTCINLIPVVTSQAAGSVRHLGVSQPPLALVRLTADNTVVVELPYSGHAIDTARFAPGSLRARALTPIGTSVTLTLAYVNQAGANATHAQSAWSSPAALDAVALALAGGETGAKSIQTANWAVVTTGRGVIEVYVAEARTPAL